MSRSMSSSVELPSIAWHRSFSSSPLKTIMRVSRLLLTIFKSNWWIRCSPLSALCNWYRIQRTSTIVMIIWRLTACPTLSIFLWHWTVDTEMTSSSTFEASSRLDEGYSQLLKLSITINTLCRVRLCWCTLQSRMHRLSCNLLECLSRRNHCANFGSYTMETG